VIRCDDKAPSVPDVILQVISEILSENHQAAIALAQPPPKSPKSPVVNVIHSPHSPRPKLDQVSPIKQTNLVNSSSSASSSQQNSPAQKTLKPNAVNNLIPSVILANSSPKEQPITEKLPQSMNRNRTRKTITKTFTIDGQMQTIKKTVNTEEEERQRALVEERRRDLIEHRRNLNEDRRKLIEQTRKQDAEKESLEQDFKEQKEKLLREFEIKLAQVRLINSEMVDFFVIIKVF